MEFRQLGEKEYLIVSVGSWAVSYLPRGFSRRCTGWEERPYSGGFSVGVGWRGGAGSPSQVKTTPSKAEGGNGVGMRTNALSMTRCLTLQVKGKEVAIMVT
jgi:hypothetical protein